jgi:hypothetical protein
MLAEFLKVAEPAIDCRKCGKVHGPEPQDCPRHPAHVKEGQDPVIEVPRGGHPVVLKRPVKRTGKDAKYPFQGLIDFQGLKIDVENKRGSYRRGKDKDGNEWKCYMHHHYGEIRGTKGTDGDLLDVYVGPNHDSSLVVVVHQHRPDTGKYDEDKVMLGFNSVEEAIGAYKNQYDKPGFYREGEHTVMPIGAFWRWVHDRKNKGKKLTSKLAAFLRRKGNPPEELKKGKAARTAGTIGGGVVGGIGTSIAGTAVAVPLGQKAMAAAKREATDSKARDSILGRARKAGVGVTDAYTADHLKGKYKNPEMAEWVADRLNRLGARMGPNFNPATNTVHMPRGFPTSNSILAHEVGHATGVGRLSRALTAAGGLGHRLSPLSAMATTGTGIHSALRAGAIKDPKQKAEELRKGRNRALAVGGVAAAPTLISEGVATGSALRHAFRGGGLRRVGTYSRTLAPAYGTYAALHLAAPTLTAGALELARRGQLKKARPLEKEAFSGEKLRSAAKAVGRHLYQNPEPYIGGTIGTLGGAAAGGLPKYDYKRDPRGRMRKKKLSTKDRMLNAGVTGVVGGLAGTHLGLQLRRSRKLHEETKQWERQQREQWRQQREQWRQGDWRWSRGRGFHNSGHSSGGSGYAPPPRTASNTVHDAASAFESQAHTFKTKKDVKAAYRAAAMKHHPDRGGNPEKMKAVNEAWSRAQNSDWYSKLASWLREKQAGTPFLEQDRPGKVKEIYKALKRDHPEMPAEMKARIAARKGKKSPQSRKSPEDGGPAHKAPLHYVRTGKGYRPTRLSREEGL